MLFKPQPTQELRMPPVWGWGQPGILAKAPTGPPCGSNLPRSLAPLHLPVSPALACPGSPNMLVLALELGPSSPLPGQALLAPCPVACTCSPCVWLQQKWGMLGRCLPACQALLSGLSPLQGPASLVLLILEWPASLHSAKDMVWCGRFCIFGGVGEHF